MGREAELFKAAQTGNVEFLERVFSAFLSSSGDSPPVRGRGKRQSSGVSLRKGASPNMQDEQGYTLLHHAALNGHCEAVSLLLRCGASTTIPDCSGSGPLHLAAWKGDLEVVKVLVSQGPSRANVNQQNDTDNTPLHLAAQYGYSSAVDCLLQRHADPILHNCQGETPLDLAAQYGHLETVHLLISHCPELLALSRGKFSPLHLAARNGHTLVALSLINAGISVNAMGEHGTPLHEAALFGKPETVKMLLDKGASTDATDRASKSVLDALREFPAERAREIIKMIEDHKEETTQLGESPRMVAVARMGYSPASASSSALAYSAGDHVSVLSRSSREMFEGSVHGRSGSFFSRDFLFHREVGGRLIPVESPDDIFPPPPSPSPPSQGHTHNHTHSKALSESPPIPPKSRDTHRYSNHEPLPPGLEPRGRHQSVPLPVQVKKLSKKEKRFQLSRDDGAYCELSAIDPVAAVKSGLAGSLRLNPVGPAFAASLPGQPESPRAAVTTHNGPTPSVARQPEDSGDFLGSYYVLEVGNFQQEGEGGGEVPVGYYMLDMAHMEEGEGSKGDGGMANSEKRSSRHGSSSSYENVSSGQSSHYQNVELKKKTLAGPKYENIPVKRCHERQKSSPLGIPQPSSGGRGEGVRYHEETKVVRRMSTSLPSQPTTGEVAIETQRPAVAGEREEETPPEVKGDLPRQRRNRNQIYEMTSVSFGKKKKPYGRAVGGASSDAGTKVAEDERAKVNGEIDGSGVVMETTENQTKSLQNGDVEPVSMATHDTLREEGCVQTSEEEGGRLTKMMEPNSLPFAGLVISSSAEGEGEGEEEMRPIARERAETVWDDHRVQREWSQIDSLLEDMSGSIETTTSPPALLSWLSSSSMEKYRSNLETNGFDSLLFLGGGLLMAEDLKDIGITSSEDQLTLQATAHLLPPPPSLVGVASVPEWLEGLQLSQLSGRFEGHSLQKISRMWDIELCSVVGVELVGHRRRLLYGISELCRGHPDWSSPPSPSWHSEQRRRMRRHETPPTATPSLFRDYTDIQPSSRQQTPPSSPSSIELRPPLESQGGNDSRPHSIISTSSSWRHSVASLVEETVNYEAKYLGSVIVVRVRGKQSTEEACLRLRTSTEHMQKLPDVLLSFSWKCVKFIDGKTKMVVSTHSIQDISYCSQDIEDKRVFAYITKDKTGMYYSHVFMATSEEIAGEILMTIGQAFEIAYQKVQRARTRQTPPRNSN